MTARNLFNRVPFLERLLFTKHLATMVKAGIPIAEALATLVDQAKSPSFKTILTAVLKDIKNGQSLAKSFSKHPQAFDQFYISLVKIGEGSGKLEENLKFLSEQLAKDYATRQKIKGAMLYPTLIFSATIIMGGFIGLFILPQLVDFFTAFEIELPLTTKILLFVANLFKDYGIILVVSLLLLALLLYLAVQLPKIKFLWHTYTLKIPLFGQIISYGQLARFSRNLGTLLKSGVPVTKSLDTTANTLSNLKFRHDLLQVGQELSKGKKIGAILDKHSFPEFPPLVSKMISVGEKTGKLEDTLLYLSEFYEDEIDNISKNLTTILEPILLVGIGLIVGFVALAIISPIYELTGSIRR